MALFQPARGSASGTEATQSARGSAQSVRSRASGYEAVRASRDFWTIQRRFGSFVVPTSSPWWQASPSPRAPGRRLDIERVASLLDDDDEDDVGLGQIMLGMTRNPRSDPPRHPSE
jgi:hypothetical protein